MEIKIDNIVSYEDLIGDAENVLRKVNDNGKIVLVKDNRPAYVIVKYSVDQEPYIKEASRERPRRTLQEAMKMVLLETNDNQMHAAELADIIFERRLYIKKDGGKARYNQIRARSGHYPDLFEALPGNIIKLKEGIKE